MPLPGVHEGEPRLAGGREDSPQRLDRPSRQRDIVPARVPGGCEFRIVKARKKLSVDDDSSLGASMWYGTAQIILWRLPGCHFADEIRLEKGDPVCG